MALALGYDEGRITKTLLLKAETAGRFGLAVLPVYDRANLRVVAARLGDTHCAMASPEELQKILHQPSGGVSPLANEGLPVFLDESLRHYDTVLVGGGTRGVELEVSPADLGLLTGGEWISFSRPSGVTPPEPPAGDDSKTGPKI
jgi:Cys-tRNA(Pro)/Cys-tRNA(Cys) deacylase